MTRILIMILTGHVLLVAAWADDVREGPTPRPAWEAGVGRLMPRQSAKTISGEQASLLPMDDERATIIALTSTTCPVSRKFAPLLGRLSAADRDRSIRWIFIDVTGGVLLLIFSG